jgi:putative phosphoesterase
MNIAVFSDIHGNIEALDAVLKDIESFQVDHLICLGDLVGYLPFPNEVIDCVRTLNIPVIMGNYDQGVGFDLDDCGCAYPSEEERKLGDLSLRWTQKEVSPENKGYLQSLLPQYTLELEGKKLLFVHGSPRKINEYLFEERPESSILRMFPVDKPDLLACGHTHKAYIKTIDSMILLNDGSAGRPKDGISGFSWALIKFEQGTISCSIHRVQCDLPLLKKNFPSTGLPLAFLPAS